MIFADAHLWDGKRILSCSLVFLLVFVASTKVFAAVQWRRFEDPSTSLSVRYPSYWGIDLRTNEYDSELIATFLAPITDTRVMGTEPAAVELRAVKINTSGVADIRGLADGFQRYYLDRPHVYRAFQRRNREVSNRPAVEFRYTMLGEEETRYVREVWQVVGGLAVSMRFSTYAQANRREDHYVKLFEGMVSSLVRLRDGGSLTPTDDLRSLGGKLSQWANPRARSAIPNHELPRTFFLKSGLRMHYPEGWSALTLYGNHFSESVVFTGTERNALPMTVTAIDLYAVFIANAEEFADRTFLSEKGDTFWLETVVAAHIANDEKHVPEFELLGKMEMEVDGRPAVLLEYRGLDASGARQTRREVLTVDRRVLYSFTYMPGTEGTRMFEKMVEGALLP